jgi:hypothetical protein
MANPEHISPQQAHEKLTTGAALLVCAHDNDEKFESMRLDGAISLSAFQSSMYSPAKDQEIIFYCS